MYIILLLQLSVIITKRHIILSSNFSSNTCVWVGLSVCVGVVVVVVVCVRACVRTRSHALITIHACRSAENVLTTLFSDELNTVMSELKCQSQPKERTQSLEKILNLLDNDGKIPLLLIK